jgi:hypothetical protein
MANPQLIPVFSPALAEKRGYNDIDPEQAWEQWQQVRQELAEAAADRATTDPS